MRGRQREVEGAAVAIFTRLRALNPDLAAELLDDTTHNRKPQAVPRVILLLELGEFGEQMVLRLG